MNKRIAGMVMMITLGVAGVAMASTIKYDYDREVDFSQWKVAAWRTLQAANGSMTERRITKAVAAGFEGRGYKVADDREKADFLIDWRAATWQDVRVGTTGYRPAFGRSAYIDREAMGALVITVYDRKTGKVAWHGVVSDALADDPDEADRKTTKAVAKLLKKFPARGGGA